jgi:hypothetical protein
MLTIKSLLIGQFYDPVTNETVGEEAVESEEQEVEAE